MELNQSNGKYDARWFDSRDDDGHEQAVYRGKFSHPIVSAMTIQLLKVVSSQGRHKLNCFAECAVSLHPGGVVHP